MAKIGFDPLAAQLAKQKGVYNAKGLAAAIGRKKLGKKRFQALAAKGRSDSEKGGG